MPRGAIDELVDNYRGWMITERALADRTVGRYERTARRFLSLLPEADVRAAVRALTGESLTSFLLAEVARGVRLGSLQGRVAELRSLCRFLYVAGLTDTALAESVPPVPGWKQTRVPPRMTVAEVEALLASCDRAQLIALAERLGAEACAADLLAAYDAAVGATSAVVDDLAVSMATVYPGENIGVWVSGPANIPATFLDAGIELQPGADAYRHAANGRAFISVERLGDLRGVPLVLLQSHSVDGEDAALEAIRSSALWGTLPAVVAGEVVVIDRLGYPGVEGRTRLAEALPGILGVEGAGKAEPAGGSGPP